MAIPRKAGGASPPHQPDRRTFEDRWEDDDAPECLRKWLAKYGFAGYAESTVSDVHKLTHCPLVDIRDTLRGNRIGTKKAKRMAAELAKKWHVEDPVILLFEPPPTAPKLAADPSKQQFIANLNALLGRIATVHQKEARWLAINTLPKTATTTQIDNRVTLFSRWAAGQLPNEKSAVLKRVANVSGYSPQDFFSHDLTFDHLFTDVDTMTKIAAIMNSDLRPTLSECIDRLYSELTA